MVSSDEEPVEPIAFKDLEGHQVGLFGLDQVTVCLACAPVKLSQTFCAKALEACLCYLASSWKTLTWRRSLTLAFRVEMYPKPSRQVVGTGQFGSVRLVRHVPTGNLYALKVHRSTQTANHVSNCRSDALPQAAVVLISRQTWPSNFQKTTGNNRMRSSVQLVQGQGCCQSQQTI